MPNVETASLAATCGHTQTGSSTVLAGGNGVSKVGVDTAIGLIIGPGSQSVYVEGYNVSLVGDIIVPHPPCEVPIPIHCSAKANETGVPTVFAGAGFTFGPGGAPGQSGGVEAPDLRVTSLELSLSGGIVNYPATTPTHFIGTLTIDYTIQNFANDAGAFNVGLWTTLDEGPWILHRDDEALFPEPTELLEEKRVISLSSGATYEGSFTLTSVAGEITDWSAASTTWYTVYPDIDKELLEPDEDNSVSSKPFIIT